jgi:hypothetical protein
LHVQVFLAWLTSSPSYCTTDRARRAPTSRSIKLISRYDKSGELAPGTTMFGGTLAAQGGVRPTNEFAFELEDPVLGRKIAHAYKVRTLAIFGIGGSQGGLASA